MRAPIIAVPLFLLPGLARADGPFPWRGTFLEGEVGAHRMLKEPFGAAIETHYHGFPGDQFPHGLLALAGARWERNSRSSIELLAGYGREWFERGSRDLLVVGVRKLWDFPGLRLRLRLRQDHSFRKEAADWEYVYHGDYAAMYRFVDLLTPDDHEAILSGGLKPVIRGQTVGVKGRLNPLEAHIGFRVDHRWSVVDFGPFLAFTRPRALWQAEVQHFYGLQDENRGHSVRLILRLHL